MILKQPRLAAQLRVKLKVKLRVLFFLLQSQPLMEIRKYHPLETLAKITMVKHQKDKKEIKEGLLRKIKHLWVIEASVRFLGHVLILIMLIPMMKEELKEKYKIIKEK